VNPKLCKRTCLALIGAAALTIAGMPAGAGAQRAHAGTITLGFFAPLSGPYAAAGIDMENGAKLAIANVNKAGGVLGQQVSLDAQDSPCNPQVAVQAAQKLVTDGVAAVIGPYCSGDAIPASTIFHRAGIPMVDPAATNPKITAQGFNNIFRVIGSDDQQGAFAAGVIVNRVHARRVALIHDNTVYAKGLATYTQDALQKYPGVKVVLFDAITSGSKDFSSILTRLRTLNPQATYFTGYYADGGLLLKQFVQLGVPGQFMAGDSNNAPQFIQLAGADAPKALITTAPIAQQLPSAATFVKQFTATYHTGPAAYSAYTYDATAVALSAIKAAKSTSPSAIISALSKTKAFPGITGKISFTATGNRAQINYILLTVRNGKFVIARP
jgi:ABC-type branched-subunit amino acid transport system substrate-binding protein